MARINPRLRSIDAFRALTMLLMIFVNDLILVDHVPAWLEHAEEGQDRLGLADTVFPAFLFIVGLSIPLAIKMGRDKGLSQRQTLLRILSRSVALLAMGIYIVNYEEYTTGPAVLSKWLWMLLAVIAFFLVWLVYPAAWSRTRRNAFRGIGLMLLLVLAILYKGGTPDHPRWMEAHWYGILGLIGWAYLFCALIYAFAGDRFLPLAIGFLFFLFLSFADNIGSLKSLLPYKHWLWFLDSGGLPAFTMAGVLTSVFYGRAMGAGKPRQALTRMAVFVPVLLAAGFAVRFVGGISKLDATPSWILICTGISLGCFIILAYVVDLENKDQWYNLIKPAGTITLTCYLLPYIHFALFKMLPETYRLPLFLRDGWTGVFKSLVFAFLIVLLTGVFEKKKIRLSI
jgi:predicted acyltransferase